MSRIENYVTGASGFIGKRLMERLRGHSVAIPHRQITDMWIQPYRRMFFLSAYGNMADHQDVRMMIGANIRDPSWLAVRTLALEISIDSFLLVSSSSVTLPVQTPYSRTKRAAEEMILATPLPACVVRPYSVTGRGEQPNHLIPTLIRSCLEGTAMDLVPDATHDYVDVEDVVDGLLMLSNRKATGVFELGNGIPITNEEVLSIVESVTGRKANVRIVEKLREFDHDDWFCREPAEGWTPKKHLGQSVAEMVEAYLK